MDDLKRIINSREIRAYSNAFEKVGINRRPRALAPIQEQMLLVGFCCCVVLCCVVCLFVFVFVLVLEILASPSNENLIRLLARVRKIREDEER